MELQQLKAELTTLKSELSDKLTADVTKSMETYVEGKLKSIEEKVNQVKGLPNDVSADDLVKIKSDLNIVIKDFETLQIRYKNIKNTSSTQEGVSFKQAFKEATQEASDKIKNIKKGESIILDLKDMTFSSAFSTADNTVSFVKPGIIELPKRKVHIRQLLPGGTMGNKSTFDYAKEVAGSGSIATASEGATKAQIELALQENSVRAEWIAGWLRISRNMLDDIDGMTTFLQSRLPELLLREEDNQILYGNGNTPNISGITDTGNFTAPASPPLPPGVTSDVEQLAYAVAQLEGYDREANGILLHPYDWYRIWMLKASGSGEYDLPMNVIQKIGDQMYIAGVPVFRSTAMGQTEFIVGDWRMGANFILREAPRVEFFYEDGTNVRENKVTVRIEERVALPIYGDNYFIYGDFGSIS